MNTNTKIILLRNLGLQWNQTASDYLIYDADDEATQEWLKHNTTKSTINTFFHFSNTGFRSIFKRQQYGS